MSPSPFDPVPPRLQSDAPVLVRVVSTLAVLASAFFLAALISAYAGATDAAFVFAALVMTVGAICLFAVTAVDV